MLKRLLIAFTGIMLGYSALTHAQNPTVTMETTKGNIVIELYPNEAPDTVKNFLAYVNDGFYNGTIFHRVINNFMIQGGGHTEEYYDDTSKEKTTRAPIKNESKNGLSNVPGTIAMARTPDPHSATAQFFINVVDNSRLDGSPDNFGYAVFGKVIEGMDVVMAIATTPTRKLGFTPDVPAEPIVIKKISTN